MGPQSSLAQGFFLTWVFCTPRLPVFQRALCLKGKSNEVLVLFFKGKAEAGKQSICKEDPWEPRKGWETSDRKGC